MNHSNIAAFMSPEYAGAASLDIAKKNNLQQQEFYKEFLAEQKKQTNLLEEIKILLQKEVED